MAENNREAVEGFDEVCLEESASHNGTREDHEPEKLECAVCLQGCVHPVELPCGHIFCFLCVKGVANQSKRCAMCRKELPAGYLERPQLVNLTDLECSWAFDDGQLWFYEGHNGWWQYDERTSAELETSYKRGDRCCELLIAGFLYVIDFDDMVQFRRNDPSRRRRIKRDLATISKKGIAGLRINDPTSLQSVGQSRQERDRDDDGAEGGEEAEDGVVGIPSTSGTTLQVLPSLRFPQHLPQSRCAKSPSPVPTAPSNTPQTPHTPSQDSGTSSPTALCDPSLHQIVQDMQNLLLNPNELDDTDTDDGTSVDSRPCAASSWTLSNSDDEIL